MARAAHPSTTNTRLLVACVLACLVLALLPVRFLGWAADFGDLFGVGIAPVSGPMATLGGWINPAAPRSASAPEVEELQRQVDEFRRETLRQDREITRLHRVISELQAGISLTPDLPVRVVTGSVVAHSGNLNVDLLEMRPGADAGITPDAVVTARGVHLFGRVVHVGPLTCTIQPITDKNAGKTRGVIMISPRDRGPLCMLEPVGDGTLRGPAEDYQPTSDDQALAPGQVVRLDSQEWPEHAQMLLIGVVERVEADEKDPLRRIVTVRPELRLERLREVIVRMLDVSGQGDTP